jgi:hypothetical protein
MRKSRLTTLFAVVTLLCGIPAVVAQTDTTGTSNSGRPTSGFDRLFLAFAEDATLVERQWWEGQLSVANGAKYDLNNDGDIEVDTTALSLVAAFQPWLDFEVGGRVGFGDTDTDPDTGVAGSGATDLDVWGKFHVGGSERTEWAVGGVLTVPTGDESAGLGEDAFGVTAFGSMRHRLRRLIVTAHAGVQFNGDGRRLGETADNDGDAIPVVGAGVIYPFGDHVSAVGEFRFRDGRLKIDYDDSRVLAGLNWRPGSRGIFRFAVAGGLSDGAPDLQALFGYAAQF